MTLYFIEARCFAAEDQSLFLGTIAQLRARLDELSALGWMTVAGFELASGLPAIGRGTTRR